MIINRKWAMPNSNTFEIPCIKKLVYKYVNQAELTIDPFANNCKIANITNDLNPDYNTDYHLDALAFLKQFSDNSIDCVLYDPPYSLRQVSECYKNVGIPVTMETTQSSWRRRHIDEIQRILKPGGSALCFGWNSNGVGKTRGFTLTEILIVAHGGSHNDTICTVEIKEQAQLKLF
jgi:hypothetical protein